MGFTVDLADLSQDFDFSRSLSPTGRYMVYDLVCLADVHYHGETLHPIFIIVLALNQECNQLGRGCLYHISPRENKLRGHPCDLVFIDEPWTDYDMKIWKSMNWTQRLELCRAGTNIGLSEVVVPICARILLHDEDGNSDSALSASETHKSIQDQPKLQQEVSRAGCGYESPAETFNEEKSLTSKSNNAFPATFLHDLANPNPKPYDPAIKPGVCAYSRPLEDISTVIMRWANIHSTPFVCLTAAAEHESVCERYPTPGDLSETFMPSNTLPIPRLYNTDKRNTPLYPSVAARAAKHVFKAGLGTNREVIVKLIELSNADDEEAAKDLAMFGRVRYFWGEILSRIEVDTAWCDLDKLDFWPKK